METQLPLFEQEFIEPIQHVASGLQDVSPAGHHCQTAQEVSIQQLLSHSSALDAVA
jgi:hypothetical protein